MNAFGKRNGLGGNQRPQFGVARPMKSGPSASSKTPVDTSSGKANSSSASITAPSLTTGGPNEMLVGLFGAKGPVTITPPAGMTERAERSLNISGEKVSDEAADSVLSASGSTGNRVATASAAAYNIGQLVALRPASGGGGQNQPPVATVNSSGIMRRKKK